LQKTASASRNDQANSQLIALAEHMTKVQRCQPKLLHAAIKNIKHNKRNNKYVGLVIHADELLHGRHADVALATTGREILEVAVNVELRANAIYLLQINWNDADNREDCMEEPVGTVRKATYIGPRQVVAQWSLMQHTRHNKEILRNLLNTEEQTDAEEA
jgi:hypothetical protein